MPELVVQIAHTVTTSRLFCSRMRRCTVFLCRLVTFALIGVDPLLSIYLNFQDRKVKSLVSDLLALKQSTDSDPLLERAFTVPHIPRHIFVLASPATIGQVVRRLSLPLPHLIPREEWKNSMDTVQWTQRRGYPVGSFVKILESGPYHGDLGYVMAVDLKDGKKQPKFSAPEEEKRGPFVETPQFIIVAAVPRLQVKSAPGKNAPHDLELQSQLIRGQIKIAHASETIRLKEVVRSTREQNDNAALRKVLLKEKSDLVWQHGQEKRETERPVVQLEEGIKDLRRRAENASASRAPAIQEELRKLEAQKLLLAQDVCEKMAMATAYYEVQLSSLQSRIDATVSPPVSNKRKPKAALFDPEDVEKQAPGTCIPFEYTTDEVFEFANEFPTCFDRPTILTDLETLLPDVGSSSMTLWSLDTMMSSARQERVYFYQGRVFLRGLELLPIYDNRAVEFANPTLEGLAPFVQSGFDRPRIDRLFSAHHWQLGDKLRCNWIVEGELWYTDDESCWYYLREIVWNDLAVRARKIDTHFGYSGPRDINSGLNDVMLPLHWTQRVFEVGDDVEITFGMHKGKSGALSEVTAKTVTVVCTDLTHVSSIVIQCRNASADNLWPS